MSEKMTKATELQGQFRALDNAVDRSTTAIRAGRVGKKIQQAIEDGVFGGRYLP